MVELGSAASVAAVLRENIRLAPERTAVVFVDDVEAADGARQWSYARLDTEARKSAAWLSARVPVGERVLLLYPTGLDFAAALVGCLYAGTVAVPAPLPGRYRQERARLRAIAANAGISAILTDLDNLAAVTEWAKEEGHADIPVLATNSGELADASSWTPVEADRETLAMINYTSGATGAPKGVALTHDNILRNVENQCAASGLAPGWRVGGWLPHHHAMGLLGQLLPALVVGATAVVMRPSAFLKRPYQWLRMIDKFDLTATAAPGFAFEICLGRVTDDEVACLDLSRWRFAAIGAEPLHASTVDAFVKRFAPAGLRADVLSPCYGLAEATAFVAGDAFRSAVITKVDPHELEHGRFVPAASGVDLLSSGTPSDFEIRVADPRTGEVSPPGALGEIWLRGPSAARGYWRDGAATASTFTPAGFIRSGDLGTLHEGELYVVGRVDEMLRLEGRMFTPQEVEGRMRSGYTETALIGAVFTVSDAETGTDPMLVATHEITGRRGDECLRELSSRIKADVADEFRVRPSVVAFYRRNGIPRTAAGKIQRTAMRRLFLERALNAWYVDYEPSVPESLRE
ncbi:Acyl-CoA synthetase (AMP-forming)/AMP-acid ligase II [Actinokineospora alba]|uniref:Acyl-CoA synthetase (AMP-forming)/AMP-acid ligase II n=1 Tax=Actinokineospora alba TaxID=504798 RepID=A0A1H0FY17_9PSEU|nr:fatty acyl-AMP ligase [Actinokineospora alba]TDP69674.1 acyl-CoA synthetase (AMP-forming)/AMP-acid ligase II [Actinokineospora alba]SDI11510.1 Acyl-CoA synthetase (AMP-forming)/AMP-acid ligase II [Actinokineospora alba]SDN99461.1 Acyl-CoA synthetase (AMP-forming)/AMP-acid ligase II [Actinokineospora alba]